MTAPSFKPLVGDVPGRLRLAVGFATAGRREILSEALRGLDAQTRRPDAVFVCPAVAADFDAGIAAGLSFPVHIVHAERGSSRQRNAILDVVQDYDAIAFFDDDFFAWPTYVAELEGCFLAAPDVVAASGLVIADGIKGPGLTIDAARAMLKAYAGYHGDGLLIDQYNAYGCNMCVRLAPVHARALRFDETLPLYGWLEDVDFCRRLSRSGRVVWNRRMAGVHLGAKGGRTSGVRFGYSQIANPIHIWRKGSGDCAWALRHIAKNVLANLRHCIRPEPWVDRRGRLKGNVLAVADLLRGKVDPARILELE